MSGQHTQEWIDAACGACEGLTQDHFDGGWTAKGLSGYAQKLEQQLADERAELAAARALLREVARDAGPDAVPFHPASITLDLAERIRSYLDAVDTLGEQK